jgi:hypothetical protein
MARQKPVKWPTLRGYDPVSGFLTAYMSTEGCHGIRPTLRPPSAFNSRIRTMKTLALVLAASVLTATAALAQDAPVVSDADANGTFSLAEVQAAYPAATQDAFNAADIDASGALSAEELAAAIAANAFAG